jgi:hypothetical protein
VYQVYHRDCIPDLLYTIRALSSARTTTLLAVPHRSLINPAESLGAAAAGAASVAPCGTCVLTGISPMRRVFLSRNVEGATDAGSLGPAFEGDPPGEVVHRGRARASS